MFSIFPVEGGVCAAQGFFAQGVHIGLKKEGMNDVAFIRSEVPCVVDAIFTTNKCQAAPIRHFLRYGTFQTNFLLINAKNANAMTGNNGLNDIDTLMDNLCKHFNVINPIMSSTGVIGVRLPHEKIATAFEMFDLNAKDNASASLAIMTTDAFPKTIAFRVQTENGGVFHIGAIAKGAGMINPAMATMLCFITTDAAIPADRIKLLLQECDKTTFNAISVDGDTSTNDSVILMANGLSGVYDEAAFKEALKLVMREMALAMVRDGEGAVKACAYEVTGALSHEEAEIAAKALSNSLLVKTMLFGGDPNWGRVACIVGASGVECAEEKFTISFDDVLVYEKGNNYFTAEVENKAAEVMKKSEFTIRCDLGVGNGKFTAYGCDLGHNYVTINADYRT